MIGIEKRRHKRINYKLKADVTYGSKHSQAMIENWGKFSNAFGARGGFRMRDKMDTYTKRFTSFFEI
jgi:hypothetical protein